MSSTAIGGKHHAIERSLGRQAPSPVHIPPLGWRDIAWRIWAGFENDRIMLVAAGATFYGLLSFVPALTALISLYGLVFDPSSVSSQTASLSGWLPPEAQTLINEQLKRLTAAPPGKLGLALIGSLAVSLWSSSSATKALIDGLNIVYDEIEKRSWIMLNIVALVFTLGGLLLCIALLGSTIVVPELLQDVSDIGWLPKVAMTALVVAALWGGITILYRWGPSRRVAKWRWLFPGTLLSVVLLAASTLLFSWYTRNFGVYNAYGSIGSVIGFMTWCWIAMVIVLLGAETNAEIEHQTAIDSTEGHPKPMGRRGAQMADTIGQTVDKVAPTSTNNASASVSGRPSPPLTDVQLVLLALGFIAAAISYRQTQK